jgi:hypothetical protein
MHIAERKNRTNNVLLMAQFLVLFISSLSLFLSSKCIQQSPASFNEAQRSKLNVPDCCTREEKENYFKIRFTQEIQNLMSGNETEFVKQLKVVQQRQMEEQLVNQRRNMEDQFAVKISSIEQTLRQQVVTNSNENDNVLLPSNRVGKYVVAMARVPRDSFISTFSSQFGGPFMDSYPGVKDLMLLYGSPDTRPNNFSARYGVTTPTYDDNNNGMNSIPLIDDAGQATENCDQLHVVFTVPETALLRQCIAIVPNHESFHVHQLSRPSEFANGQRSNLVINRTSPFQLVSRYHRLHIPDPLYPTPRFEQQTLPFFDYLRHYVSVVDVVLDELRVILSKIAINNQLVVMLCNHGQSVLLSNFICSAKARNLELSNVIVFTTDQETTDLVTALGLTAYYDKGVRINLFRYYLFEVYLVLF